VKIKIQTVRDDLPAPRQKLIHSGKILKDEQTIAELGISDTDFIVCMITKEIAKKPTPAAPAPAPVPVAPAASSSAPTTTTTTATPASASINPSQESVDSLIGMGFPANESRAALIAAMGNPDLAYEFLLTGIPTHIQQQQQTTPSPVAAATSSTPAAASSGRVTIESLRLHPQFNTLKQLVQQNPAALPQVLTLIGNQNPELLAAIHANNDAFIAMMNEPITEAPPAVAANPITAGGPGGMPDPAAMMQMLASMPAQQRAMFAQQLGMAPEQLEGVMQMMASMPPGQMENILNQAGMGGMGGMGRGADPPGVIRLTQEEMESVNRLVALGFTQQQAAQAYLACDKNETLAANLLFDGGFGDDDGGYGGPEDDNMYN